MITIKKSESIILKGKGLLIKDGQVVNSESGEVVDLINILEDTFKNELFDISATQKTERG